MIRPDRKLYAPPTTVYCYTGRRVDHRPIDYRPGRRGCLDRSASWIVLQDVSRMLKFNISLQDHGRWHVGYPCVM